MFASPSGKGDEKLKEKKEIKLEWQLQSFLHYKQTQKIEIYM